MQCSLWDSVLELTKVAQEKGGDPLVWAIQVSSCLTSSGVSLPSLELANFLVSHICWENNLPVAWKFLEKALLLKIVSPIIVFPLLSTRFVVFWFSFGSQFVDFWLNFYLICSKIESLSFFCCLFEEMHCCNYVPRVNKGF